MPRYIVTDLTRFSKPDIVCMAVVDSSTGACLRPMPYPEAKRIEKLDIHPGAILDGELTPKPDAEPPHTEDATYETLSSLGPASGEEFEHVLRTTLQNSISEGFGYSFGPKQKHIPHNEHVDRSLITIKVSPKNLEIHEDRYNPGKIKASFRDASGHNYPYLSITDRGFHNYALQHQNDGKIQEVENFIESQETVYLRIGLSRRYNPDRRDGYWLQVNGIYTFPHLYKGVRTY